MVIWIRATMSTKTLKIYMINDWIDWDDLGWNRCTRGQFPCNDRCRPGARWERALGRPRSQREADHALCGEAELADSMGGATHSLRTVYGSAALLQVLIHFSLFQLVLVVHLSFISYSFHCKWFNQSRFRLISFNWSSYLSNLAYHLSKNWIAVQECWIECDSMLNRDTEQADTWMAKQEAFLSNEDLGDSLDSVEALIKKHEDFEKSLAAQEEKIKALDEFASKLIEGKPINLPPLGYFLHTISCLW